jgi:hypothetical protein
VRGKFGRLAIFTRGGYARRIFKPRDPKSLAQLAVREAFKDALMAGLTKEQADLLYAAIAHLHEDLYSPLEHGHDHGALAGLGDDDHMQYLNQTRGDVRYSLLEHEHAGGGGVTPGLFEARLSLSSTLAVTTADLAGEGTLYLHPFKGNRISLYDGEGWHEHALGSVISLSLGSLPTASRLYDIFVHDDSGTLTLTGEVWTNNTTRAAALGYQDGALVKSGTPGLKYAGTIYINASKQCTMEFDRVNDTTIVRRHVWNYYNRLWNHARHVSTVAHTYTTNSYRKWNNTDALTQEVVIGLLEEDVTCFAGGNTLNGGSLDVAVNWSSGGGELVDLYVAGSNAISAFTGGGLRRQRISTPGLVRFDVVEIGTGSAGTFNTGVLDVALNM